MLTKSILAKLITAVVLCSYKVAVTDPCFAVTDSEVLLVSTGCRVWSCLAQEDKTASYSFEHDNLARALKCYNGTGETLSAEYLLLRRLLVSL
jgi:hypothetical protein